jgi:hypothetical protein
MRLKFLLDENGRGCKLLSSDGKVLVEYGVNPEFVEYTLYSHGGESMQAKIILDEVEVIEEMPVTVVDADEESVGALPAAPQVIEYDFDPHDYEDCPRDDEEDDYAYMEGLCPDCAQELCLRCGQCYTPAWQSAVIADENENPSHAANVRGVAPSWRRERFVPCVPPGPTRHPPASR